MNNKVTLFATFSAGIALLIILHLIFYSYDPSTREAGFTLVNIPFVGLLTIGIIIDDFIPGFLRAWVPFLALCTILFPSLIFWIFNRIAKHRVFIGKVFRFASVFLVAVAFTYIGSYSAFRVSDTILFSIHHRPMRGGKIQQIIPSYPGSSFWDVYYPLVTFEGKHFPSHGTSIDNDEEKKS